MALTAAEVRRILASPDAQLRTRAFDVLAAIAAMGSGEAESTARDLLIRTLDRRDACSAMTQFVDALVRRHGLFPYLLPDRLGTADRLAYEVHRPVGTEKLVFHAKQAEVYRLLCAGYNVILSAPTSFGKTLIADAVIATGRYRTVVLIVPTIALIDETRRRLSVRFRGQYKIVTDPSQDPSERTIYVLTQERLLDIPPERMPRVDFFAVDEFYKLDSLKSDERAALLNQAFHRLHSTGAQFYLLGPNIGDLTREVHDKLEFHFIRTDFQTVALDIEFHHAAKGELETAVVERCRTLEGPTLLYTSSPDRARVVARQLLAGGLGRPHPDLSNAANWVEHTYHPRWLIAQALRHGVGIHHGRMPRALAHHIVRLFNEGKLPWLVVTSTLIEGVNTAAKNVIIVDNRYAKKSLDSFTYNNICGRGGRMFRYFIGKVVVYGAAPTEEEKVVDIPACSQRPGTPSSILIQLPWNELTPESRRRLRPFYEQQAVSLSVIRAAKGIDPQLILDLANTLHADPHGWSSRLAWRGRPTYEQLLTVCRLVYQLAGSRRRSGVSSPDQLAKRLDQLRVHSGEIRSMAEAQMSFSKTGPDEAIEDVLEFLRHWPGHTFPQLLRVLQTVSAEVLSHYDLPAGDYRHYAAAVEAYFSPPVLTALEEYGLPAPLTRQLLRFLPQATESTYKLDEVLDGLRALHDVAGLTQFEQEMLNDTIATL